jgi:hypothetical protein
MLDKPKVELTGVLGDRFTLVKPCAVALAEANQRDKIMPLLCTVAAALSDAEALMIMSDYVDIVKMRI